MSFSPRALNSIYGEQTNHRIEAFNAKSQALSYERDDIACARHSVMEDAYTRKESAPRLRFRADALRDRTLQCDLDELALFDELAELDALVRGAWLAEVERLKKSLGDHLRALNSVADEMELEENSEQRTHLVDYDPMLNSIRHAITHAEKMAAATFMGADDRLAAERAQASVLAILA